MFGKGEAIFNKGDPADRYYKVVSGTVRLDTLLADGRRYVIDFPVAGDTFGFTTGPTFNLSAEAIAETIAVRYARRVVERVIESDTAIGRQVLASICARLTSAQDQLLLLGRMTAMERVALFMLTLTERVGRVEGSATDIDLFMTRADIAD